MWAEERFGRTVGDIAEHAWASVPISPPALVGLVSKFSPQGFAVQATCWAAHDHHMAVLPRICEKLH